jgi:nicotinate-nucleotide pyrophosphorylase (carboxylating)
METRQDALIADVVARALAEDVGTGDVTTQATVPPGTRARARITQKAPGVVFGLACAETVFRTLDPDVALARGVQEGVHREGGLVLDVEGDAAAILTGERTALNLLGRLSGVASLTHRYVRAVEGTGTRILDTRKTTPGLRLLEKAAVLAGGGGNQRIGLYDALLIKENHAAMAGGVGAAVRVGRERFPDLPLQVECRTLEEVDEALAAGATRILLDNMDPAGLRAAVQRIGGRAEAEGSGGMSLEGVRAAAEAGLDSISVGALTHSAPALDLSLLLEPLP